MRITLSKHVWFEQKPRLDVGTELVASVIP